VDFPPPDCPDDQRLPCSEKDWVQCAGCSRLVCTVHDEVVAVRHSGKYAKDADDICTCCVRRLYEAGELSAIQNGYQYINRC
jgi:hypothetical protein